MIRRYPNVGTQYGLYRTIIARIHSVIKGTQGTETSKYLKEKKIKQ